VDTVLAHSQSEPPAELLQEYRDRVVAIHNGQVVAVGDSKTEVSEQVHRRLGDVIVYIQRVSEHPRIASSPASEWCHDVLNHFYARLNGPRLTFDLSLTSSE